MGRPGPPVSASFQPRLLRDRHPRPNNNDMVGGGGRSLSREAARPDGEKGGAGI